VIINYPISQYPVTDTKYHLNNFPAASGINRHFRCIISEGFDRYGQRKVIFSKKKQHGLKKQAALEILNECPSYNGKILPEFYKRMGFPISKN